jgi:hypothetical protein
MGGLHALSSTSVGFNKHLLLSAVTVYKFASKDSEGDTFTRRHDLALLDISNHYISENGSEVSFTVAMVSKNCYKVN